MLGRGYRDCGGGDGEESVYAIAITVVRPSSIERKKAHIIHRTTTKQRPIFRMRIHFDLSTQVEGPNKHSNTSIRFENSVCQISVIVQYPCPSPPFPFDIALYIAAMNATIAPTTPPIPATAMGAAAAMLTCEGLAEVDNVMLLLALALELLELDIEDVVGAGVTETLMLVELAVTVLVDIGVVDTTTEVDVAVEDEVVIAEALAREAEKAEQRPIPTEAATSRSLAAQAERRHGVTSDWMAE